MGNAKRAHGLACCFLLFFATWISCHAGAPGGSSAGTNSPSEPSGGQLLREVIARLPTDPMQLTGDLIVRKRHGVVLRRLQFDLSLNLGESPSHARYTIRDAFGVDLEQLAVTRSMDGGTIFTYAAGSPPVEKPLPDLFGAIQESDLCWVDLALSFLWWDGARVVGSERVLDRDCYVVDIPAPLEARESSGSGAVRYTWVRAWIDKEMKMLFQAEGLDANRTALRRLWVRSFKRFDNRWMIKDLEVQQFSGDHRTKLQIRDVGEARPTEGVPP